MIIAVWKTGHEIADTVAQATGFPEYGTDCYSNYLLIHLFDAHIAYGILRGTADIFRECDKSGKPWFHIDRGYFKPGHYDGYYRVSLKGTQQTMGLDMIEPDMDRWDSLGIELKPWRGFDQDKPVLIIPPTEHVRKFFNYTGMSFSTSGPQGRNYYVRHKGDPEPINFDDYNYVLTFNSSVGWQALQNGIPCISDPSHSIVGAYFNLSTKHLPHDCAEINEMQYAHRERLFGIMARLQMTLDEMRAGRLWELLSHLLSISAMTPESPSAPKLPPIPSRGEHSFLPTSAA